jgi:PKD domain-containing protein
MIPAAALLEAASARAGCARRGPQFEPLLVATIVIGLLSGCGSSRGVATTGPTGDEGAGRLSTTAGATVRSPGLAITLAAAPVRFKAGSPVVFSASAYERDARGAVGYQLIYGDGTSAPQSAVPLFCLAGRGRPVHERWRFAHRYRTPGRFTAALTVHVNCSSDRARATVTLLSLHR